MVSIIIPAYNVEKYIERCIRSAINQTLKNIEIIVINDGSTDRTRDLIEKIASEDTRVKIINKKNGGLSSTRNCGIKEAKGEYIHHLDGDDWLESNACEELYLVAKKNNLDLLICDFYKDFDNGKKIEIKSFEFNENVVLDSYECLKELSKKNNNTNIWAKFIKRELYLKNRIEHLEEVSLGEDLVTTPKLISSSKRIGKMNKSYYHYIYNPKSITNNSFSKKIGELFICFEELEKFFEENKINNYDLKVLKANHLANIFYNTPLNDKKYFDSFYKFVKYVENLEYEILKELKLEKKILYILFKTIKNNCYRLKLINLFSDLKKLKLRIIKN